ncbi:MAG: hypothetical protein QF809_03590 [Candidatus Peribacteraceae bacterium]|jgi:hypothetical protein|nr:hypothetical protein [Candidatus Peribacteraceae bacterium]|tara:strand:- start:1583 stop:3121 length:1539 start_codon:yes stop_codon:yes gene_type:complete
MTEIIRRHRHLLLAPLLLTLIVVSLPKDGGLEASVKESQDGKFIEIKSGTFVLPSEDLDFELQNEVLSINEGSVLVSTDSRTNIRSGSLNISSVKGAFTVHVRGGNTTVASISAPVQVESGEQMLLIPVNFRWKGNGKLAHLHAGLDKWIETRAIKQINLDYKRDQLEILRLIPDDDENTSTSYLDDFNKLISKALTPIRLPLSKQSVKQAKLNQDIDDLITNAEEGDFSSALQGIRSLNNNGAFENIESLDWLLRILPNKDGNPEFLAECLSKFVSDSKLWLLFSIHPAYQRTAWALERPALSQEEQLVDLISFPQSDILQEAAPSAVLNRWLEDTKSVVEFVDDDEELINEILKLIMESIDSFKQYGYPQREKNYSRVLIQIANEYGKSITVPEIKEEEVPAESVEDTEPSRSEPVSAELSTSSPEPELTPDQVKAQAYQILRDFGALFTVNTSIEPVSSETAKVNGVIFGNEVRNFTLNVINSEVSDVEYQGKILPYSLGIDKYVEWVE